MENSIKKEIKKILEIVKVCPSNLQEICFKVLLEDTLKRKQKEVVPIVPTRERKITEEIQGISPEINKRLNILATYTKATPDHLLKIFMIEDDIVDINSMIDLGSSKIATNQRKLALLTATSNFLSVGKYKIPIEELRQRCVDFSSYDAPNFTKNLKRMKSLLAGKLNLKEDLKLSAEGNKAAVELIKKLLPQE